MMKSCPPPHAFVSAMFLLVLAVFCCRSGLMLRDTDFWWHMSAGDLIRAQGMLPAHDTFSFTAGTYPWENISWLWDALYSYLYEHFGLYMPLLATAFVNAVTLALLIAFIHRRGAGVILIFLTLLLSLTAYSFTLTPRPQQVTFLMTVLFYIHTHEATESRDYKRLLLLPPMMILWANMHGGFLVAYMILAAYGGQCLLKRDVKGVLWIGAIGVACVLAACINPLGAEIFPACNRTLTSAMKPVISEWLPLAFTAKYVLLWGYVVLFLMTYNPLNPRLSMAEKVLSLVWAGAALLHERNLSLFVLLSMPSLALNFKHLTRMLPAGFAAKLEYKDADYDKDFSKPVVRGVMLALCIVAVTVLLGTGQTMLNQTIPDTHPKEEAKWFNEHFKNMRVFNDYFQGAYLLRQWNGSSKIFVDGRAETAYPPEITRAFYAYYTNKPGWEKLVLHYQPDAAIIPLETRHAIDYFESNPHWRRVFEGKLDRIYIFKP